MRSAILMVGLAACSGEIMMPSPAAPGAIAPPTSPGGVTFTAPVINACTTPGGGTPARMRMLWQSAFVAELTTRLGADAAAAANNVLALSLTTDTYFRFDSGGALVTDDALRSIADAADAVAAWSLSTDAIANEVYGCNARTVTGTAAQNCFKTFLQGTGTRLLRRTMTPDEVNDTLTFFTTEVAAGDGTDAQEGFRQGLASLLTHPDFLYVRDRTTGLTSSTIEPFALASKMSFALTGQGPDDALWAVASDGTIAQPAVMKAQVARLLATPQARSEAQGFFRSWLDYQDLAQPAYSSAFLNGLDTSTLQADAIAELDGFTTGLAFDQRASPTALLTSSYLPATNSKALQTIYGTAQGATQVNSDRAGLFTRVGWLASGSDDWNVVLRGVPIVRNLLCRSLSPPANLNTSAAAAMALSSQVSYRQGFDNVTSSPACQACHKMINPLGDSQGDFDAIGRHVSVEDHYAGGVLSFEVPVDASGDLTATLGPGAVVDGAVSLSQALAASSQYTACFANRVTAKALGRIDAADGCVATTVEAALAGNGTMLDAIAAVYSAPDFAIWQEAAP